MALRRCALTLLCVVSLAACQDEQPSAPTAPGSGGGSGVTVGPGDGGTRGPPPLFGDGDGDEDAGSEEDTALPTECVEVEPTSVVGEDAPTGMFDNAIATPLDLEVTRVVTTWEPGCSPPELRIELSDGECPDGQGHEVVFRIGVEQIESGLLAMGMNPLSEDSDVQGLSVRYRRPGRLSPSGEWGTCAGATGSIDLLGALRMERGETLQSRFFMDLTACDGSGSEPQSIDGTFEVTLRRGLEDACPDRD